MQIRGFMQGVAVLVLGLAIAIPATAQSSHVPSRVVERVDDSKLEKLAGNTVPAARGEFDMGRVDPGKLLEKIILVLKRSPEQETELAAFNERQYDPASADFHHWLHAEEFGELYGPSDSDILQVTSWLESRGLQVREVSKGRVWIQFTGTVVQVEQAFHLEMHNYLVNGRMHIANDRDPEIPQALAPVVTGLASLHDFFPEPQLVRGRYVKRNLKTGETTLMVPQPGGGNSGAESSSSSNSSISVSAANPQVTFTDLDGNTREDMTPWDFATVYNVLPLWQASTPINGKGITVAIAATNDVVAGDIATYRSIFDLPATTINTIQTDPATDPGVGTDGADAENELDLEMVSAAAPGATLDLVVSASTATTFGNQLSSAYIIDHETAPIMNSSYGFCELMLGTAGNASYNQLWQQGATEGISIFNASGDQGAAGCEYQNAPAPNYTPYGLQVNGIASSPYVTAVGGTDLIWYYEYASKSATPISTWWNSTNAANKASAKGYIPEIPWNSTCANPLLLIVLYDTKTNEPFPNTEASCNAAFNAAKGNAFANLVLISGGSGGVSACTTNSTPTLTPGTSVTETLTPSSCSGGYAKPSWQTALTPTDGKRDLPDISMFASGGYGLIELNIPSSAILVCITDPSEGIASCNYSAGEIAAQEIGGTSAASPYSAGVMAMVLQKNGGQKQGLANPVFYKMAAAQSKTACNSSTEVAGNSCFFNDITQGSNAQPCKPGDLACKLINTGDTMGVLNIGGVTQYNAVAGYDLATGLGSMNVANIVNGWAANAGTLSITPSPATLTFASAAEGSTSAAQTVTIANSGTATVTLTSETLTGTDASSFVISANSCTTSLYRGTSCSVSIEFKPLAAGTLTAKLSLADNASGTPQTVTLTGTGAASAVTVSPTSLTFASTVKGTTTAAQTVTVKNTGTTSLTLSSETITGTDATSFLKSATTCGSSLAAGASCTVSVEFKPAATGSLTAELSVADSASGSPQTVSLTGTGTASSTPTVTLTPTSIAFAETVVGITSEAQVVTLKNTGSVAATIDSIALGGTNASSFLEIGNCGNSLAAGASCSIYVAFKPTAAAALSGTLSVTDNATGSPQKLTLTGTGTAAPSVKLSATSLTFPTTTHGSTSVAQGVTLTNGGNVTLTLASITLAGTNPSDFEELNTCSGTLAPAASCVVYVAFKPVAAAAYKATLSIADSGASSPQTVSLSGTGD